jgi:hypothetical protein
MAHSASTGKSDESRQHLDVVIETPKGSRNKFKYEPGRAILDQAFEAARSLSTVRQQDIAAILEKTKQPASEGTFEPFKTSAIFGSAAVHPEWLGHNPQT